MTVVRRVNADRRRGVVAIFTLGILLVLLAFTSLTIDTGYLYAVHAEVQDAADASSLAGASGLFDDPTVCRSRAAQTAERNRAAQEPVLLAEDQIQLGSWSWMDGTFTVLHGSDEEDADAVRVVASRERVSYFFAPVFGINQFSANRQAIAHRTPDCGGVWGLEGVTVSGDAFTDSYKSTEVSYSPGVAREHGDVCSNRGIEVIGSAQIRGDASPGPGYTVDLVGHGWLTGASSPGKELTDLPEVEIEQAISVNDNGSIGLTDLGRVPFRPGPQDLYVSGGPDNLTLQAGTYYFTSIQIRSQATLTVTGPVTIYVSGDMEMGGGAIINTSQDPHNLTIYSTGASLELHGGSGFYGTVYAPYADVRMIGTSSYYGTIAARTIDIGGTAEIHVDETLDLLTRPPGLPFLVR